MYDLCILQSLGFGCNLAQGLLEAFCFHFDYDLGDVIQLTAFLAIWPYHGVKPFHTNLEVPPETENYY